MGGSGGDLKSKCAAGAKKNGHFAIYQGDFQLKRAAGAKKNGILPSVKGIWG